MACLAALATLMTSTKMAAPTPYGPVPNAAQLAWHELEYYGFIHFGNNTFTGKEWGDGSEPPTTFHPTDYDPDQIVRAFKDAGMTGIILTAKHHDGYCLWPTKTTPHSVKASNWKNGRGDVVRDISEACRRHGLQFGIYLSPWDRNAASYGKPEYVQMYRDQLRELTQNYGPIFTIWHDGANGGDGYYGGARENRMIDRTTYYDWPKTWELARTWAPRAAIFSDVGPDVRWVGNERGVANDPCWATYDPRGPEPGQKPAPGFTAYEEAMSGHRGRGTWMPAEADVSIRPGWFWRPSEDSKVKTGEQLFSLYMQSVGRGASFLLNVPPDSRGQIHDADIKSLQEFRRLREEAFGRDLAPAARVTSSGDWSVDYPAAKVNDGQKTSFWAAPDGQANAWIEFRWSQTQNLRYVRLREAIRWGQRVDTFAIEVPEGNGWRDVKRAQAIGPHRILDLGGVQTDRVRVRFVKADACPMITEVAWF